MTTQPDQDDSQDDSRDQYYDGGGVVIVAGDQPESSATAQRRALSVEWYIAHLDQHIQDSKKAYLGQLEPIAANRPIEFDTSYVGPTKTSWSATDKTAFFASLSRHSRFRSDLIAYDIGKTQSQVEDYIDLLRGSAVRVGSQDDPGLRDRKRRRWHMTKTWMNGFAPAAEEVDEDWIEREERLAEGVWRRVEEVELENKEYEREEEKITFLKQARKEAGNPRKERKEGKMVEKRAIASFESIMKIRHWGDSLDLEKLTTLDTVLDPSSTVEDDTRQIEIRKTFSEPRYRLEKSTRIALDTRAIDYILTIHPDARTTDHRRAMAVLQRRKRDRERKRMDKLINQGMTREQVMAQGGPDAVSLQQKGAGQPFDAKHEWGDEWWLVQADLAFPRGDIIGGREDGATDEIDYGGLQRQVKEKGWEYFDFATIGRKLGSSRISEDALQAITDKLRGFLEPIILHAIVLAEHTAPFSSHEPLESAADDPEANAAAKTGKITRAHVRMALSMCNPHEDLLAPLKNLGEAGIQSSIYEATSTPLSASAPWELQHLDSRRPSPELHDTDVNWERESTLTDHEYEQLDKLLDEADGEMDRVTSKRLREGIAPTSATKRRKSEMFKDETVIYKDYQDLLIDIMGKRRWRRAMKERSKQFNKAVKMRERGALRKGRSTGAKMQAIIVDSEDEEIDLESEEGEMMELDYHNELDEGSARA